MDQEQLIKGINTMLRVAEEPSSTTGCYEARKRLKDEKQADADSNAPWRLMLIHGEFWRVSVVFQ